MEISHSKDVLSLSECVQYYFATPCNQGIKSLVVNPRKTPALHLHQSKLEVYKIVNKDVNRNCSPT